MKTLFFILLFVFSFSSFAACDGKGEIISFRDPVRKGQFDISARIYRPLKEKFPVVFILPPIVGETPLDGALAANLCVNGFGAYILNVLNDPPDSEQVSNLNVHEDALIRAEFAIEKWMEKISVDPSFNGNFGILGASQGGIISSYLAGTFPQLKASVLIAAAGNVATVLSSSTQEAILSLKEKRKELFNIQSDQAYANLMRPYVTRDPLFVARNIPANSSLVFVMTKDTDVPTVYQRQLVRSLNSPEVITLSNSHVPGIIEAATLRSGDIIKFLRRLE